MQRLRSATKSPGPTNRRKDAERFYAAFQELLRAYQFRDRDRGCYGDVSVSECYALEALETEGRITVSRLAERLGLDKSGASRTARALERKGYARRRRAAADQRIVHLEATAAGRRRHGAIRADLIARQKRLLARYPAAVRTALVELLAELRADLQQRTCAPVAKGAAAKPKRSPRTKG